MTPWIHRTRLWAAGPALALLLAAGCGGGDADPAAACASLNGTKIASSDIGLPTRGAVVSDAKWVAASAANPEYCMVSGAIAAVDPAAQATNFAVALPSQWNRKAMHIGGGGFDGSIPNLLGTPLTSGPSPLARGYATFAGDGGHQAPPGDSFHTSFAGNDEMLRNYAGDALKKTRDAAMKLIALRYGSTASKTYFIGGSKGGHEGMQVMQKWPQDYDGIITAYPAWAVMPQVLAWQRDSRALRGNGGAGFLDPAKLKTLRAGVLAACDALDGVVDGLVSNVNACTFDPASLRCPGGTDTGASCLSDAQVQTVRAMQSRTTFPYALSHGLTSNAGFFADTDYAGILGLGASPDFPVPPNDAPLGLMSGFADTILRNFVMRDAGAYSLGLDPLAPGAYLKRIQDVSAVMDASSTDIDAYIAKGGKWILVHGLSDQLIAFGASADYYQSLVAKFGQAKVDGFMRFYSIPGFGHGSGPFLASGGMPTLDALESWIDSGKAPGNLVVTDTNAGSGGRTRPMCVYPAWPRYKGTGDVNAATSFECTNS